MSTRRIATLPPTRRDPEGRPLCRWCGVLVPRGRQTWCSQACVDDYRMRSDPGWFRRQILKRDQGICVLCGTDTLAVERAYEAAKRSLDEERMRRWSWAAHPSDGPWCREAEEWATRERGLLRARARAIGYCTWRHTWEADHVLPVVEGGGECGLEGYRTLCLACHRRETAALARRRAQSRRRQGVLEGVA